MSYRFARLLIPFLRYIVFYRFRTLAVSPTPTVTGALHGDRKY